MTHKLYFRYGTMSSSKTANLLMVAHNYKYQNKKIIKIKPKTDNRFSDLGLIKSRCGLESYADIFLKDEDDIIIILTLIKKINFKEISCLLVDEAQFLTEEHINQLRILTKHFPIICYGLRTNYKTELFEGSKRLMEIADTIEEIKTTCHFCNKKAIINLKHCNGKIIKDGSNEIDIGSEEKYLSSCWRCWNSKELI